MHAGGLTWPSQLLFSLSFKVPSNLVPALRRPVYGMSNPMVITMQALGIELSIYIYVLRQLVYCCYGSLFQYGWSLRIKTQIKFLLFTNANRVDVLIMGTSWNFQSYRAFSTVSRGQDFSVCLREIGQNRTFQTHTPSAIICATKTWSIKSCCLSPDTVASLISEQELIKISSHFRLLCNLSCLVFVRS